MALANEIKTRLARYVAAVSTLEEFQEWLDKQPCADDAQAHKLSMAIEWEFCDFERGVLNAEELMRSLRRIARSEPQVAQVFVMGEEQEAIVLESLSFGPFVEGNPNAHLIDVEAVVG